MLNGTEHFGSLTAYCLLPTDYRGAAACYTA